MLSASNAGKPLHLSSPFAISRRVLLWLLHITLAAIGYAGKVQSAPLNVQGAPEDGPSPPNDPQTWIYLGTAIALVLLGGAFAGLTIA